MQDLFNLMMKNKFKKIKILTNTLKNYQATKNPKQKL